MAKKIYLADIEKEEEDHGDHDHQAPATREPSLLLQFLCPGIKDLSVKKIKRVAPLHRILFGKQI